MLTAGTGFLQSGDTFDTLVEGASDANLTFFKVFDFSAGSFTTDGVSDEDVTDGFISASALSDLNFDSGRYAVKAFDSAAGETTNFVTGQFGRAPGDLEGGEPSLVRVGDKELAPNADVSLDEVVDTSDLRDQDFVKVIVQRDGATVETASTDFVKASDLSDTSFNTGEQGTETTLFVDTFISGNGRSGFASNDIEAVEPPEGATFTLTEAVTQLRGDGNPEQFSIDTEEVFDAGAVTVADAASTFAGVQTVIDAAENTDELVLADLFNWTVEDTLANIEAADDAVIDGADSYSLTNEDTDLGVLSEAQVALVEGAENTGDFTFSVPGEEFDLTADTDLVSPDGADFESEDGSVTAADFDNVNQATADADTITGVVSSLSSEGTLDDDDLIDGGDGPDTLSVTMNSSFSGFSGDGGLSNVETVELTNEGSITRTFDADGVSGVEEYALTGAVNLDEIEEAGVTVSADGRSEDLDIGFTSDAVNGNDDALSLNLNNVGTPDDPDTEGTDEESDVAVSANGIESLTVEVSGDNVVDLSGVDATDLTVTGSGSIKVTDVGSSLESVDASAVEGAVDVALSGASADTVLTGEGDDTIRADTGDLTTTAQIDGGAGDDRLNLTGNGTVQFAMAGVQTLSLGALGGGLTFSATDTEDLTTVEATADQDAKATLSSLGNQDLTVDVLGDDSNTAEVQADHTNGTTVNVSGSSDATTSSPDANDAAITANNSSAVILNVGETSDYTGAVNAGSAETVTADIQGVASDAVVNTPDAVEATFDAAGDVTLGAGSNLSSVEELTIDTAGDFDGTAGQFTGVNEVTLSGTGSVKLATVGANDLDFGVTITAEGLGDGGLETGNILTGEGQSIEVDVSDALGDVSLADGGVIHTADDGDPTGSVTINADGPGDLSYDRLWVMA